jgi:hypothetical protein
LHGGSACLTILRRLVLALAVLLAALWWLFAPSTQDAVGASPQAGDSTGGESAATTSEELVAVQRATAAAGNPTEETGILSQFGATAPIGLRFTGRCVAAEDGSALAGVTVQLRGRPLPTRTPGQAAWELPLPVQTGEDGCFMIETAPASDCELNLRCVHADRVMRFAAWAPGLSDGTVVELGDVRMARGVRVGGHVLDEFGAGVARAQVRLAGLPLELSETAGGAELFSERSDQSGAFHFPSAVPAGAWPLSISSGASTLLEPAVLRIADLDTPVDVLVRVQRRECISGVIVDPSGLPIAGATVRVLGEGGSLRESAMTNAEGAFMLYRRESDQRPTALEVSGFAVTPVVLNGAFTWGSEGHRLVVKRSHAVEIRVVEKSSGFAVEDYAVRMARSKDLSDLSQFHGAGSHPDGRLLLGGLQEGDNYVVVIPADRTLLPNRGAMVRGESGASQPVVIELERMAPFTVLVVLPDGTPVPESTVRLLDHKPPYPGIWLEPYNVHQGLGGLSGRPRLLAEALTGADGLAALKVPPSEEEIHLEVSGQHMLVSQGVIRPLAQEQPLRVIVSVGGVIRGTVRLPVGQADRFRLIVQAIEQGRNGRLFRDLSESPNVAAPDADGTFRFDGLNPNLYWVSLASRGTFQAVSWEESGWYAMDVPLAEVQLGAGEERVLELDASDFAFGSLTARFVLNGVPASRATVALNRQPSVERNDGWKHYGSFLTNEEGMILAEDLVPGRYWAHLLVPVAGSEAIELISAQSLEVLPSELSRGEFHFAQRRLIVQIVADESGSPLAGVRCFLQRNEVEVGKLLSDDPPFPPTDAEGMLDLSQERAGTGSLTVLAGKIVREVALLELPEQSPSAPIVLRAKLRD